MKHKIKLVVYLISLILFSWLFYYLEGDNTETNPDFKTYFFNENNSDVIILSKNNKHIMIDTGNDVSEEEILSFFQKNSINKLDYLIITNFRNENIDIISNIINNIEVGEVLQNSVPKDNSYYNNYLETLENKNIKTTIITDNKEISLGYLKIIINSIKYENDNDNNSLIVSTNYKKTSYLFMSDIENDRLKYFIKNNKKTYDLIKLPNHGHYQKELNDLLKNTKPKYAIITSSNAEQEDKETINLLKNNKIKYYLTRKGPVTITSDGNKINMKINKY